MGQDLYLGLRPEDLEGKPYARFWNPEMGEMQPQVLKALAHGPEARELGFAIEQADLLLDEGYLPLETGVTRLSTGQIFVACLTKMPGVTSEMIDWWFAWHPMEDARYKLWHPKAHLSARATRQNADEPNLTNQEKYLRNPHFITEYVGSDKIDIVITFSPPETLLDTARFPEARIGTAICATVGLQKAPIIVTRMIHLIRETEDGVEMRSRFWMGEPRFRAKPHGDIGVRLPFSKMIARRAVGFELGRDMLVHCAMEMNHLAGFLPDLYRAYHPDEAL